MASSSASGGVQGQVENTLVPMKHDPNSPLWRHVTVVDNIVGGGCRVWTCHGCQAQYKSSYSRVKIHLTGVGGVVIKRCPKISNEKMVEYLREQEEADKQAERNRTRIIPLQRRSSSLPPTPRPTSHPFIQTQSQPFDEESPEGSRKRPKGALEKAFNIEKMEVVDEKLDLPLTTLVLRRLVKVREALSSMVISNVWLVWRQSNTKKVTRVKSWVLDEDWWAKVEYLLSFTEPILSMIRYVDTDEACLGEIYDGIDSMLECIRDLIQKKGKIQKRPSTIPETFFRKVLEATENIYLNKNPTATSVLDLVRRYDGGQLCYDHFAFRTFDVDGCGISAMAQFFLDFGYVVRDELRFPKKHLRALWFSPPEHLLDCKGEGVNGPLPRIFISELLVDKLSPEAQVIIKKYTDVSAHGNKYAALASVTGSLTWPTPLFSDYQLLARESEYAAWTLVNGYALNHLTISVHRLKSDVRKIEKLNELIQSNKFKLNSEGSILKVSPDGRLLQSSTVADSMVFHFAEGTSESVPASYIEFAERLVSPEYENLPDDKILECHRRDGFEVGNADKIFESTSAGQICQKLAC
ncbi:hypothetical protein KI387_017435 [Taxus chinensis]|uniref:2-oxoadipate dioxygenase/decarboxylase n=1 Tax=Taxus chinensis TaxID=29808 RepID=A0AA38GGS5_TAXCH|nr:hypothetical protein KI387_017435 [Taxus chinensis]